MSSNKVRLVNREVMFEDFRGEWLKEIDDVLETRGDWPSSGEPDRSGERRAEEYEQGGAYIVAGENQRGQRYECRVVPEAVDYLCDRTRGRNITSERAGGVIGPVAERFKLPYHLRRPAKVLWTVCAARGGGADLLSTHEQFGHR